MAFQLSAFADEIAPELATQVQTLKRLGVSGLDLRSIEGTNVLDLTDSQLELVASECTRNGLHVQAIGSPVNKVALSGANEDLEFAKLERAIHAAKKTGTRFIRVFSPEVPPDQYQNAWMAIEAWMARQVHLASEEDIVLLHENDAKFYGAFPEGAKRLLDRFGGPNFKAAFDFANTVLIGYRPMTDWFPWLLPHLHTLHIKDAIESDHQVVPAGHGDGQILETLNWLVSQGWNGPLTIEPHLASAGKFGGFSGEQLFEEAVRALRDVIGQVHD